MIDREPRRWKCGNCGQITKDADLLHANSPFAAREEIVGCPHCRSVCGENFAAMCEVRGCTREISAGVVAVDGVYLSCCYQHFTEHGGDYARFVKDVMP